MNYYNPYTGNRKKIMKKVLTVLVCAIILTSGTFIFGNYLKDRAERTASNDYSGIGRNDVSSDDTNSATLIPPLGGDVGCSVSVTGLCVPLESNSPAVPIGNGDTNTGDDGKDEKNTDSSFDARLTAAADGYSGVLIPLTGSDGLLLYNSLRAGEASRLPSNPTLPDMESLSAAVSLAKSMGLRTTALISAGALISAEDSAMENAVSGDARLAADAAEAGFDEIIVCSLITSPDEITGERSRTVLRYLNSLTASAGTVQVGLAMPPEVYLTANLSPQIELFASRSVFLAMELGPEKSTAEYVGNICKDLAGTLSVYNMRILLSPADTASGDDIAKLLKDSEHENYLQVNIPDRVKKNDSPDTDNTDSTEDNQPNDDPPAAEPPEAEPSETEPPEAVPPDAEPPAAEPPAADPSTTTPPATTPPATTPPATTPPAAEPPAAEPPATEPPATEPPATEPPVTEPPATDPPVTEPPAADIPGDE